MIVLTFVALASFAAEPAIRIWGNGAMAEVVDVWREGFQTSVSLHGSGTAMAGLYGGVADIAFLGRPATAKEIMAFEWVFQYKPTGIEVLTGSVSSAGKSPALRVIVNRENPKANISGTELAARFGCGLETGRAHIYDTESNTSLFFARTMLGGSRKWNWESVVEYPPDHADAVAEAVAKDRNSIGILTGQFHDDRVRTVAVDGIPLNEETVMERRYPLARAVYAYINVAPGQALKPSVAALLRFVLSAEGQRAARPAGYLPLTSSLAKAQMEKLGAVR